MTAILTVLCNVWGYYAMFRCVAQYPRSRLTPVHEQIFMYALSGGST